MGFKSHWSPLLTGYLKCNVDANFYDAIGATEWRRCLRDHRERFVLAGIEQTSPMVDKHIGGRNNDTQRRNT
jgi:hypothetical protein